jgi:hypothetical protein
VTATDADVDSVDEIISVDLDQSGNETSRGANSALFLFVILNGPSAATLQLFAKATDESEEGEGSSSSSPSGASEWVLCEENNSIDADGLLWKFEGLPAGKYKVVLSALTGSGEVIIRESHSS